MVIQRASAPLLFVRSLEQTAAFYGIQLGFAVMFPGRTSDAPLIVICRGGEQIHFREGGEDILEVRPAGAPRWRAAIQVPDADALAADFVAHGVSLQAPPCDRPDGLWGFEVVDPDGHVLLFVHPRAVTAEPFVPAPLPVAKGTSWIVQGWVWVELASGALGAVA